MREATLPIAALIAAYVAAGPALELIARRLRRGWGALFVATGTAILSYVFMGIVAAWPAAIVAGAVAFIASALDYEARGAGAWLWIRAGAVVALAAIGGWLVPALHAGAADASGAIGGPWWPPEIYVFMLVVAGAYVTVEWGCPWVERAIQPFASGIVDVDVSAQGLPNGGRMIGRLERLLIFLFVLIGAPTAIGFLVTAKSILRFGEIKDRESHRMAEYIIIGTLMSFGFAIVSAYLVRLVLGEMPNLSNLGRSND